MHVSYLTSSTVMHAWSLTSLGLALCLLAHAVTCCDFPPYLQSRTWVRDLRTRQGVKTNVYFWSDIMETQFENMTKAEIMHISQKYCLSLDRDERYVVASSRNIQSSKVQFTCVKFVLRSMSIVQMKISKPIKYWSANICDERNLRWEPLLLVDYNSLDTDYVSCPLSGGFDMQINDMNGIEHICNSNDVPMRFEANCLPGEGLIFNFQDRNCVGEMPMDTIQKASCVTTWQQDGYDVTVIRKPDSSELWCLLLPTAMSTNDSLNIILLVQLSCATNVIDRSKVVHYDIKLNRRIQQTLCEDQHRNCHRLPCIGSFVNQCLKTCGKCDPNVFPASCVFPFFAKGDWLINDKHGRSFVNISLMNLRLYPYGSFDCVTWPGYPELSMGMFTSVSMFSNGCTPRYTCIKLRKAGVNSLGIALSQSKVWPIQNEIIGRAVCTSENFQGDSPPFYDRYRTFNDVYKPVVSISNVIKPRPCNLDSGFKFVAVDKYNDTVTGAIYTDCSNSSTLRTEFYNSTKRAIHVFSCIGQIHGKYWEHIILLQSHNDSLDTRCLIFSEINTSRVILIESAECDQLTWMYVDAGIRTPILDMTVRPDYQRCTTIKDGGQDTPRRQDNTSESLNTSNRDSGGGSTKPTKRSRHDVYDDHDFSFVRSSSGQILNDAILYSFFSQILKYF